MGALRDLVPVPVTDEGTVDDAAETLELLSKVSSSPIALEAEAYDFLDAEASSMWTERRGGAFFLAVSLDGENFA